MKAKNLRLLMFGLTVVAIASCRPRMSMRAAPKEPTPQLPSPGKAHDVRTVPAWAVAIWKAPKAPELSASDREVIDLCSEQRGEIIPEEDNWFSCSVHGVQIFSIRTVNGRPSAVFTFYKDHSLAHDRRVLEEYFTRSPEAYRTADGRIGWKWVGEDVTTALAAVDGGVGLLRSWNEHKMSGEAPPPLDAAAAARLARYHELMIERGFARIGGEPTAFAGDQRAIYDFTLKTQSGHCYIVFVLGGNGVSDADIAVLDTSSRELAKDVDNDQDAVAPFCASTTESVQIQAMAYTGSGPLFLLAYGAAQSSIVSTPRWPSWDGPRPAQPARKLRRVLQPSVLYKTVSKSVYIVISGALRGTAVAVSDRHLLTNCHVIDRGDILLKRGDRIGVAHIARSDPETDRCILTTEDFRLAPVPSVRAFHGLEVGEAVYAIGAPQGREGTLSHGLISRFDRKDGVNIIQTTAPISPGSSGGPLFDAMGSLIGITSFQIATGQNLNFAIAADEWWK